MAVYFYTDFFFFSNDKLNWHKTNRNERAGVLKNKNAHLYYVFSALKIQGIQKTSVAYSDIQNHTYSNKAVCVVMWDNCIFVLLILVCTHCTQISKVFNLIITIGLKLPYFIHFVYFTQQ